MKRHCLSLLRVLRPAIQFVYKDLDKDIIKDDSSYFYMQNYEYYITSTVHGSSSTEISKFNYFSRKQTVTDKIVETITFKNSNLYSHSVI